MVYYKNFCNSSDHITNIRKALEYCKLHGENGILFENETYELYDSYAVEKFCNMSNHGERNLKRIAFLLEDMDGFCIDGCGATFVLHNAMMGFCIENCKNTILKNFTVTMSDTMMLAGKVVKVFENGFAVELTYKEPYYIQNGVLRLSSNYGYDVHWHYYMTRGKEGSKDYLAHSDSRFYSITGGVEYFSSLRQDLIKVENSTLYTEIGDYIIFGVSCRHSSNIYLKNSQDTLVENVTMHRGKAMGIVAEKCTNVTVDRLTVTPNDGEYWSLNQDATHFIHCRGLINVKNCTFEEQLDDAINVHGIYTKVVEKDEKSIVVKYMHRASKGLNIYDEGTTVRTVNPLSCIPLEEYKVISVDVINIDYTRLFIEGGTQGIEIGMNIEDVTWMCDLNFTNNRLINNRARGMLIGTGGKVRIENNYFHTPGPAILFESSGDVWYESGGTNYVVIRKNLFEGCNQTHSWGQAAISTKPRKVFDGNNYFHKKIEISENLFKGNYGELIYADNVETLIFNNNTLHDHKKGVGRTVNVKNLVGDCDELTSKNQQFSK